MNIAVLPALKIGITLAILRTDGKILFEKDRLIICTSKGKYLSIDVLSNCALILSYPELLFFS